MLTMGKNTAETANKRLTKQVEDLKASLEATQQELVKTKLKLEVKERPKF